MTQSQWSVDRSVTIGSGGFGQVHPATDPEGNARAVKIVPIAPGADRELLVVELLPSRHIVPTLHVESSDQELFLFMPLASGSLRDRLSNGAPIHASEAIDILQQIASGLVAMEGQVVHRDLKPENVLLLDGSWAICDFGIARYTEASTATETQKYSMTSPYAAPEQWRLERATSATDVYAFGVIAHEVVGGKRPFAGPGRDEYRQQHLSVIPPKLQTTKKLVSLFHECLYKGAQSRPTPQNLLARLESAGQDASQAGASALADAHQVVVESKAAEQKAQEEARTEQQRRELLMEAALDLFGQISGELVESIQDAAPVAVIRSQGAGPASIELGLAKLSVARVEWSEQSASPFDVIAYSSITLTNTQRLSRSHSLYYCDFEEENAYRWYELAFCGGFSGADFENEPRALKPDRGLAALDGGYGMAQLGRRIVRLELGSLQQFVDEWGQRFGLAAVGKFPRVSQLPEGNPVRPSRS